MSNFKRQAFVVENKEQAIALQEYLFSQGYSWRTGKTLQFLDKRVFTTWKDGDLTWSNEVPSGVTQIKVKFEISLKVGEVEEHINYLYNNGSVFIEDGTRMAVIFRDGQKAEGVFGKPIEGTSRNLYTMAHQGYYGDIIAYAIL
jgi:hypothetical protein